MALAVRGFFRRTVRTVNYTEEEALVAAVAGYLGRGLMAGPLLGLEDFVRAILQGDRQVRELVVFASHVGRRRTHVLGELDAVLRLGTARPRWVRDLLN
jgi:hypothetical protein